MKIHSKEFIENNKHAVLLFPYIIFSVKTNNILSISTDTNKLILRKEFLIKNSPHNSNNRYFSNNCFVNLAIFFRLAVIER